MSNNNNNQGGKNQGGGGRRGNNKGGNRNGGRGGGGRGNNKHHHGKQNGGGQGGGQLPQHAKSSLYKTELCRQFAISASCSYGSRCQFAHGEKDLRRRSCRHPKYKTQKCKAYWNQGFCPYGSRCMFLHDEKPEEVENITTRLAEMTMAQQDALNGGMNGGRPRTASNRSLSHDSTEAKRWAQTVRGDTRTDSFSGSTGSAGSPIFIPGQTGGTVPGRMYSFDLYESAGVPTPETDGTSTADKTMKGTWPVIKTSSTGDQKNDSVATSGSPGTPTEGGEDVAHSGSRLSFFQRLRSKSISAEGGDAESGDAEGAEGKKKSVSTTSASTAAVSK